jgi:hypothetical protein
MYASIFGAKANTSCVHNIRIVCNNTLRAAEAQGAANDTLRKFGHYKNIHEKFEQHIIEMGSVYAGIKEHQEKLEYLADQPMNSNDVKNFMENFIPIDIKNPTLGDRKLNSLFEKRTLISRIFDNAPDLQGPIKHTRYSMLQAVTNFVDHRVKKRDNNDVVNWYDNTTGIGDKEKQMAYNLLGV